MMKRLADRLAWLFFLVPPITGGLVYLLDAYGPTFPIRLVVYALFAIAATVLAAGHFRLLTRSGDGKASVWLIAFAYYKFFLAAALWAVAVLVWLSVSFGPIRTHQLLVAHVLYAFIAAAMAGTVLAASVFAIGYRRGCLQYRVHIYPLRRKKGRKG